MNPARTSHQGDARRIRAAGADGDRPALCVLVCGAADAGKSSLIGRLRGDGGAVPDDALAAPEREQAIAMDIAWRGFASPRRRFIVAEAPGRGPSTRSIVAAASLADAAVLLVDARQGLVTQTRRHAWLAALMGCRHLLLAVNKLDLVQWRREAFERIATDFRAFAESLGIADAVAIPVCAPEGDNLARRSAHMPWYAGPTLLEALEACPAEAVTATRADGIEVERGAPIAAAHDAPEVSDRFECTLVWLADEPLLPGRRWLLKLGTRSVDATVSALKYRIDPDTRAHLAARTLGANEIGVANLSLAAPLPFEPYAKSRELGGFVLIDRDRADTVACGLLHFALRRAGNLHPQALAVGRAERRALMGHAGAVLWFTGLSGAGKSTLADRVASALHAQGIHTAVLDGDNVRHGLNRDLGFTDADRVENIRRVAEVARLMADAGLVVLTAFISPFRAERAMARALFAEGEFIEIHVDAPLAVAERRDPKGLYAKARRGELPHFTGIDSPYEPPGSPELRIDTAALSAEAATAAIVQALVRRGIAR